MKYVEFLLNKTMLIVVIVEFDGGANDKSCMAPAPVKDFISCFIIVYQTSDFIIQSRAKHILEHQNFNPQKS